MANGTPEYKLGQLDQGMQDIVRRLESLETKVDALNTWRWKTIGAVSAVALVGNVLIKLFI